MKSVRHKIRDLMFKELFVDLPYYEIPNHVNVINLIILIESEVHRTTGLANK